MAVPDDKPSVSTQSTHPKDRTHSSNLLTHQSINTPHLFAHIYATHASKIIEEYIATDQKDNISRSKIELDIIRLTHEDPNMPLKHKVSCTSMVRWTPFSEIHYVKMTDKHADSAYRYLRTLLG